jgi:aerobic-type carbon monoxide dehydrogenase small subunit (CoxS/CutS family)
MAKKHVSTTINGDEHEFLCHPQQTLLDVLRDELSSQGAKRAAPREIVVPVACCWMDGLCAHA